MRIIHIFLASFVATPAWAATTFNPNKQLVLAAEENNKWYPLFTFSVDNNGKAEHHLVWDSTTKPVTITKVQNKYVLDGFELGVSQGHLAFINSKSAKDSKAKDVKAAKANFVFNDDGELVSHKVFHCPVGQTHYVYVETPPASTCSEIKVHVKLYDKSTKKLSSEKVGSTTHAKTPNGTPAKESKALFVASEGKDGKIKWSPIVMDCAYSNCNFFWNSNRRATKFTLENSQLLTNIKGQSNYVCLFPFEVKDSLGSSKNLLKNPCDPPIKVDSNNKIEYLDLYKCDSAPGELFFLEEEGCEKLDLYLLPYDRQSNGPVPGTTDKIKLPKARKPQSNSNPAPMLNPPPARSNRLSGFFQVQIGDTKVPLSIRKFSSQITYLEYQSPNDAEVSPPEFVYDGQKAQAKDLHTPGFVAFKYGRIVITRTATPAHFEIDDEGKVSGHTFYSCVEKGSVQSPGLFTLIQGLNDMTCTPVTLYFLPTYKRVKHSVQQKTSLTNTDSGRVENNNKQQQTGSLHSTDSNLPAIIQPAKQQQGGQLEANSAGSMNPIAGSNEPRALTFVEKPEELRYAGSIIDAEGHVNALLAKPPVAAPQTPNHQEGKRANTDVENPENHQQLSKRVSSNNGDASAPALPVAPHVNEPIAKPAKGAAEGSVTDSETPKAPKQPTEPEKLIVPEAQVITPKKNQGNHVAENPLVKTKKSVAEAGQSVSTSGKKVAESENKGPEHDLKSNSKSGLTEEGHNATKGTNDLQPNIKDSVPKTTSGLKVDFSKQNIKQECELKSKVTFWKGYTGYTTYCEKATTVPITVCEEECVPSTMTVAAATTLTVTGVFIVPETTTVAPTEKGHSESKGGFSPGNQEDKVKVKEVSGQNVGQKGDIQKGGSKPDQANKVMKVEHPEYAHEQAQPKATKAIELMGPTAKNIGKFGNVKTPQPDSNTLPNPSTIPFANSASKNAIGAFIVGFAALLF